MAIVKIESYINNTNINEADALADALLMVNALDNVNNTKSTSGVVTKLYYITPILGRILVVINDEDKLSLGLTSNILANKLISEYPLAKLPANIVDYKELMVSFGSTLTDIQIFDAAQSVADNTTSNSKKVTIVKVINYNTPEDSELVMSSTFGTHKFILNLNQTIINEGNTKLGSNILEGDLSMDLSVSIKVFPSDAAAEDEFGVSVANSETKLAVGAYSKTINSIKSGAAYIYDINGSNEIKLVPSDAFAGQQFGVSVAVSETKIAVGSYNGIGAVYIYDIDGTNEVKITPSDAFNGQQFGVAVKIANNKIIIGAYGDNSDAGAAYLYNLDGTGEIKIIPSDTEVNKYFGSSVDISDTNCIVGALGDSINGAYEGSAYIYNLSGTGEVKLEASNGVTTDFFGGSVGICSTKAVVGADTDGSGTDSGSAYVYNLDGTGEIIITASDAQAGDFFGGGVAISNDKIVIGAYEEDEAALDAGAIYIYDLDGTNEVKIAPSDLLPSANYGQAISISDTKIVVGVEGDSVNGNKSGSLYVYG